MKSGFLLIFYFLPAFLFCQPADTNQTDDQGRNHGFWRKLNEEGKPVYEGKFDHGNPTGTFKRYYDDGSLQAVIRYLGDGEARATFYYPESDQIMAEGKYLDQERDSVWIFYSAVGNLASRESYEKGEKQGLTEIYYADGSVSEKIIFEDGVKSGLWQQFYENGNPKLTATVVDGVKYEGKFTTYYEDGIKRLEGSYVDGDRESSWYHFNPDGSVRIIYVYRGGEVVEEHPENGTFETYWPDDIKRSEYTYVNGEKHGEFKEWYNMGEWKTEERQGEMGYTYPVQTLHGTQLRMEGKYKHGKLNGEVIYYNEDGTVRKKERYNMGELVN